eukprot:2629274-Amphidinium_carterae.1
MNNTSRYFYKDCFDSLTPTTPSYFEQPYIAACVGYEARAGIACSSEGALCVPSACRCKPTT